MAAPAKRLRSELSPAGEEREAVSRKRDETCVSVSPDGSFRVEIKLRSQSKAKRNDPNEQLDWIKGLFDGTYQSNSQTDDALHEERFAFLDQISKGLVPASAKATLPQAAEAHATHGDDEDSDDPCEDELAETYSDNSSDYGSECDEFASFKWLEQIDSSVLEPSLQSSKANSIARCSAKLIRRAAIRNVFHDEMEEPSTDTSELAFELFDRYGRLRPEFKAHPVKKGSGIWQDELDRGDLLLFDYIYVEPKYRRQALGRRMVEQMLEQTRQKTTQTFFAVVKPGWLTSVCDQEMGEASEAARTAFYHQAEDDAVVFWRKLGFRRIGSSSWFGLASDSNHMCLELQAGNDHDLPKPKTQETDPVFAAIQRTLSTLSDDECVEHFKRKLSDTDSYLWHAEDQLGDTLLHIAATNYKPNVANWLLRKMPGPSLLSIRNNVGDTPLDALNARLELSRVQRGSVSLFRIEPWSDRFKGFVPAAIDCMALLQGKAQLSRIERLRIKFGCICDSCIEGFLSPRMALALLFQAEYNYDVLRDYEQMLTGSEFVEFNEEKFEYLQPSVRQNLTTNKSMRAGFTAFFDHFATCIKDKRLPTEKAILQVMLDAGEWPPVCRNYLERGGTVYSVGSWVFQRAMESDLWAGDGDDWQTFEKEFRGLPSCRNDHEFGFVSSMCGYARVSGIRHVETEAPIQHGLDLSMPQGFFDAGR